MTPEEKIELGLEIDFEDEIALSRRKPKC